MQISTLRKLLGAQAIATIPGLGYQFTSSVVAAPCPRRISPARPSRCTGLRVMELPTVGSIKRSASQLTENTLKPEFNPRLASWLLTGIILISAEAQAQNGFTITTSRENVISIGMSAPEVRQLLGRPERAVQYRNTPGPVWTYRVVDPLFGKTEFNVEFGADERVMAKGEVVLGNEAPNDGGWH